MRIAAFISPGADAQPRAALVEPLLAALSEACELDVFCNQASFWKHAGNPNEPTQDLLELKPKRYDQVLYLLENSEACGYMLPLVRGMGGTVLFDDWDLSTASWAAWPALQGSGLRASLLGLREGGRSAMKLNATGNSRGLLNRTVVRLADGYVVPDDSLRQMIMESRNSPTPILVLARPMPDAGQGAWRAYADELVEGFGRFPRARASRRSLFFLAMRDRFKKGRDSVDQA